MNALLETLSKENPELGELPIAVIVVQTGFHFTVVAVSSSPADMSLPEARCSILCRVGLL